MNTKESDQIVQEMKAHGPNYLRKVTSYRHTFQTTPDKLFPLVCPTTEFDWMEGWHCELVYSQSLYAEYNAVFKTNYFNMEETWVVSHFEPNKMIEFVRVSEHLTIKVEARISDNLNGTCTGDWIIYATALTFQGNEMLEQTDPENEPLGILIDALDHYINHDSIKPLPDNIFNKKV